MANTEAATVPLVRSITCLKLIPPEGMRNGYVVHLPNPYVRHGMTEVSVTTKGQITIPAELRRRFGIEAGSKVQVIDEEGRIVVRKMTSILELAGSSAGKADVEELKKQLDKMRDEDASEKPP